MDVREKHLSDQNRMASLISNIITASMLVISLLAFFGRQDAAIIVRCLILAAVLVINVVCVRIYKSSGIYRHIVSFSTCVAYLSILFTYKDDFVYAYVFPIAIMVMIFQDKQLIMVSAVVAVLANAVFFVSVALRFLEKVQMQNVVVEMLLIIVACVTCRLIISMQQAHAQENMELIEERAAAQARVAKEVVKHSKELADKFQQAMEVSDTLNECMDSSHSSIGEIAESTKLTAEAIEQQTAQTLEIQQTVQQVETQTREMSELSESTKAAVEEGIVSGGGTVFVNAIPAVEALLNTVEGDEKTGVRIIAKALEAPTRQIAANAGLDGSVVLENVKKAGKGMGFDAYNETYVDMIATGIVDPAKVTRSALENAASVAAMVLTTESLVADKPEPPAPAAPAGGDMGGMY